MNLLQEKYLKPEVIQSLWEKHLKDFAVPQKRVFGAPVWVTNPDTINLLGIRQNPEISFNDERIDNDILIIVENTSHGLAPRIWTLDCTMDPKSKDSEIAHLLCGVYESYCVGNHRHIPGRTALRQDMNKVLVSRTDKTGKVIKTESGIFGINIHDNGGFKNTSLGCTIIKGKEAYQQKYKPLLLRIKQSVVSYCVTTQEQIDTYLTQLGI